ncbi:MAG: hypothetical protein ACE5Q6_24080 [Dehalococcoidia bacterium]
MPREPRDDSDAEILEEYDFSEGTRGKYAKRYESGSNFVVLDPDVATVFPDSASVNQALRALAEIIRRHSMDAA